MSNNQEYIYVPPADMKQAIARQVIADCLKHINVPHCLICGDTEKLKTLQTNKGKLTVCEFCHNIQMNYPW